MRSGRIVRARYEEERSGVWYLWVFFDAEWVRLDGAKNDLDVYEAIERVKANSEIEWYTVIRCAV